MAAKMCMMVMVMSLILMGCRLKPCNGVTSDEIKKDQLCFKNCITKCGEDNYQCEDLCFSVCDPDQRPPAPPSLKKEVVMTKTDQLWKVCFKNCITKCGEDNYQCQDLCFGVCDPDQRPPAPPSLKKEVVVTKKDQLWKVCFKNCITKCGQDNYQCQDLCFGVCDPDQRPPAPPSL